MATILSRDTLIAAVLNGSAALLAVRVLVPTEAAAGLFSQHSIILGLALGVVSVLVDQLYPRVQTFLSDYGI